MFESSGETEKLDEVLAKVLGETTTAKKDKKNEHFGSSYADLASVLEACRTALAKYGVSVTQWPITAADDRHVQLVTRLAYGGQWMRATFTMPVTQATPQSMGSAITYARRYSLAAALGIAPDDDDDGNMASAGGGQQRQQQQRQDRRPPPDQRQQQAPSGAPAGDRPNLEAALRQLNACKDDKEVEKTAELLRGLKWNKVELKTLSGAKLAKLEELKKASGTPAAPAKCPDCGGENGQHQPPCPPTEREPGADDR